MPSKQGDLFFMEGVRANKGLGFPSLSEWEVGGKGYGVPAARRDRTGMDIGAGFDAEQHGAATSVLSQLVHCYSFVPGGYVAGPDCYYKYLG